MSTHHNYEINDSISLIYISINGTISIRNCCCYDRNVLWYLFEKAHRGDIEGALIAADALLALHELHEEPMERTSYDRFQLYTILQGGIGS